MEDLWADIIEQMHASAFNPLCVSSKPLSKTYLLIKSSPHTDWAGSLSLSFSIVIMKILLQSLSFALTLGFLLCAPETQASEHSRYVISAIVFSVRC